MDADRNGRDRFNRLITRGSEYRNELLAALYELWERVEAIGDDAPPPVLRLRRVAESFIHGLARAEDLGVYMGSEKTDCYGVMIDAEAGTDHIRRWLGWGRDVPHRRVRIAITREDAVRIGVAVDRHRAGGGVVERRDLPVLLGIDLWERVLSALHDVADDERDRDEMLAILAAGLEAQSMDRVLILAEAFPDHPGQG